MMRRMVTPGRLLPYAAIDKAIFDKYGPPKHDESHDGVALWTEGGTPETCLMANMGDFDLSGLVSADDARRKMRWDESPAAQFPLPSYRAEALVRQADCGKVIGYLREYPETWGQSGFSLMMADFAAMNALVAQRGTAVVAEELEIDF